MATARQRVADALQSARPTLPSDICERIARLATTSRQVLLRCSECNHSLLEQDWHVPIVAHLGTRWRRTGAWLLTSHGGLHPRLLAPCGAATAPVAAPRALVIASSSSRIEGPTYVGVTPTQIVDEADGARWPNAVPCMRQVRAYKALLHGAFVCLECIGRLRRMRRAWRTWCCATKRGVPSA